MANRKTICEMRSTLNGDGTICVNTENGKGTKHTMAQLVGFRKDFQYCLSWLVIKGTTAIVLASKIVIDDSLTTFSKKKEVRKIGDVKPHVATEGQGSRGNA